MFAKYDSRTIAATETPSVAGSVHPQLLGIVRMICKL